MLYTVEVRRLGGNIAAPMAEMRTWLDHCRIQPASFDHSSGGPGVAFRIGFNGEGEARGFAEAFRGRLETADPSGAVLWKIGSGSERRRSSAVNAALVSAISRK